MSKRCLYCYLVLNENEIDFHPRCIKKMFGVTIPPVLLYSENDMDALALQVLQTQAVITGVQPKLSLHLTTAEKPNVGKRFTIVGMWGDYFLKPASYYYLHLPEEQCTNRRHTCYHDGCIGNAGWFEQQGNRCG